MKNAPQGWECMVVIPHLYPRIQTPSAVYAVTSNKNFANRHLSNSGFAIHGPKSLMCTQLLIAMFGSIAVTFGLKRSVYYFLALKVHKLSVHFSYY